MKKLLKLDIENQQILLDNFVIRKSTTLNDFIVHFSGGDMISSLIVTTGEYARIYLKKICK